MADSRTSKVDFTTLMPTLIICGLVFSAIGFVIPMLVDNNKKVESYTSTAEGVVDHVQEKVSTRKRRRKEYSYTTYVRFSDSDHREFVSRCIAIAHDTPRHHTGDRVTVKYDPMDPGGGCFIVGDEDILESESILITMFRIGGGTLLILYVVLLGLRRRGA